MTKLAAFFTFAAAFILSAGVTLTSSVSSAASAPILVQRTTEVYPQGKVKTVECAVSVDGVVITREFEGITSVEEKPLKLSGSIDAKLDDVAATKIQLKKTTTSDFSYSTTAYRLGSTDGLVLIYFDGVKGEEGFNSSSGAGVLRAIANSVCNNKY